MLVPSANRPTESTPHSPQVPWTEMAPTGSSTLSLFSTNATLKQTRTPATKPMMAAPVVLTKPLGAVMATRPASSPLPLIDASGLPFNDPHVEQRAKGAGAAGEHGVDSDRADAQATGSGSAQGAAGVEAEPAEGQDEAANQDGGDIVADDGVGGSVAVELADARSDDQCNCQRCEAADRVHHARSGEVAIALSESEIGAQAARASRRPTPSWRRADR